MSYFCTTRNLGYETAHAIVTGGNRRGTQCTFHKICGYQKYCSTHQHKNFKKIFSRKLIFLNENQNQKDSDDYYDLPNNHAADLNQTFGQSLIYNSFYKKWTYFGLFIPLFTTVAFVWLPTEFCHFGQTKLLGSTVQPNQTFGLSLIYNDWKFQKMCFGLLIPLFNVVQGDWVCLAPNRVLFCHERPW